MNHYEVKKLIKDVNVQSLEEKLLNGEGYKLIGQYSVNPKIKTFLQSVPIYLARIDMLQECACKGNLRDMQVLLENGNSSRNIYKIPPAKLVCSKDLNGVTVLHKVVYYDFLDIVEWLVKNYPQTVHIKDKTSRIPLHYICSCSEVSRIWNLMLEAGADSNALDINNKTPSYYLEYSENITLPNNYKNDCSDQDVPIKPSNIRIWIHDRNIKQLAKVIWAGLGDKLLTETSKQSTVNKFLKAVPYIMGIVKEIHKAVIDDNIALLKKLNRDPVPIEVLASKDKNGLTPLHKAVGLGRLSIIDYIIFKNSNTVNIRDNDGRTPLHYVFIAPPKYITSIYNRLIKAGANENLIDKNGKTPKSDGVKTNDIPIDLLTVLPKAPRIATEFPASWDWNILYESVDKLKVKNTPIHDSKVETCSTINTNKTNTKNIDKINDIDNIGNSNNAKIANTNKNINIFKDSIDNNKNIDVADNMSNTIINTNRTNTKNIDKIRDIDIFKNSIDNNKNIDVADNINNFDNTLNKENNDSIENKESNDNFINKENNDNGNEESNDNFINEENNDNIEVKESNDYFLNEENDDNIGNTENNDGIGNKENSDFEYRNKNYISLYTQPEIPSIDDNIHDFDYYINNKENTDPENREENYISLYNKSKQDIDDINDIVTKRNSFTLGEVRQALNNGLLDDILPMGGPIYKVNSLKDTNNIELSDNNTVKSGHTQERNNSAQIIVKKGSLDKIADYILDGKHEKLIGIKSDLPEVQDFLDKIPFYVNKIDQIHRCCAAGDLDVLTRVLDRRKFCLARESKSGLGLTPLHTAAVYEKLDVFVYLAAKFPETLKLVDFQGWTPMDYVNSMPDKTFQDELLNSDIGFGEFKMDYHTPPNSRNNGVTFQPEKIREALAYVAEVDDEEISDTDMDRSSNNSGKLLSSVMSASRFSVEDREYLTKAIGKPLTSGLKELIKRRPSNPTLYLAEHLTNHFDDPQSDQESGNVWLAHLSHSISSPLNCLQVLEPRDQKYSLSHDNRSLVDEHGLSMPWDIFNNYHPEFKNISRDEFGMSMIHYAASRTHNRNAFFQLLQELDVNIGLRDENYRTPRDIAVSSNIRENVKTIDKYVVHIIARGEYNKIINLLLEGYNHILDLNTDKDIITLSSDRGHSQTTVVLQNIPSFEEKLERLHRIIRLGARSQVEEMLRERDNECIMLTMAKNVRSRCSLHIAVLSQNEEIVRFLAENFPTTLDVLDNIERTALHYAMSVDQVEAMSRILIGCGAKRTAKDLKGRQPSYYFMNKFDIQKFLEEEDKLRM